MKRAATRAHPRSRGENTADDALTQQPAGSSPLTRGKRAISSSYSAGRGLIPAHAGKTDLSDVFGHFSRAHPRSRGENAAASAASLTMRGSSPLTRGKPPADRRDRGRRRLIPAHAGKTLEAVGLHDLCPAHPRSRGENSDTMLSLASIIGSSPLTRGKRTRCRRGGRRLRLIPAHAGKTAQPRRRTRRGRAHPRSRGENTS